jgi:hypothetical protein
MKTLTLGLAAATLLGLTAFAVPASAFQAPLAGVSTAPSDVTAARYHYRPRRVCTVRTIVTRDRFGRRIVRKARVCR